MRGIGSLSKENDPHLRHGVVETPFSPKDTIPYLWPKPYCPEHFLISILGAGFMEQADVSLQGNLTTCAFRNPWREGSGGAKSGRCWDQP